VEHPRPRVVPSHYLSENHKAWSPPVIIWWDTEAWREWLEGGGERQTLRLWCARRDIRRHETRAGEVERAGGKTVGELAAQIDAWTAGHKTTWCYSHNLDYDLQLSGLIGQMCALGWQVTGQALASRSPWITIKKGSKRITFACSVSWLRKSLAEIAPGVGMVKPELPGNDAPDAVMRERCAADVDILAAIMGQLLTWWDRRECGYWSATGSATAWNHWRHKYTDGSIWIDRDDDGTEHDRTAIYGGARGVARWGRHDNGPFRELDFTAAYAEIAATRNLPHGRLARFDSASLDDPAIDSADRGMIASCLIRTATARWPLRAQGAVIYPTGEFWTVLASPDIAEARRLGCLVEIGEGRYHRLGGQFRKWGRWCIDTNRPGEHGASYAVRLFAKQAGRAVIGKTAQHGYRTTSRWDEPGVSWRMVHGIDLQTGQAITKTVIAGQGTEVTESGDGDNAYPAILAFVESWCRVMLMRAIYDGAPGAAVAWDTDGMLVDASNYPNLAALKKLTRPLTMREKRSCSWVDVRGPQMIMSDAGNKMSGIPRNTRWNEDGTGEGETWPSLPAQMGAGKEGEVTIQTVRYNYPRLTMMGWLLDDGTVVPADVFRGPDGLPVMRPFDQTAEHAAGRRLAAEQSGPFLQLAHICGAGGACWPGCPRHDPQTRPERRPEAADGPWLSPRHAYALGVSGRPVYPQQWASAAPGPRRARAPRQRRSWRFWRRAAAV